MKKRGRCLVDLALSKHQNQENDSLVANTCRDNLQTSNPSPCPTIEGSPNFTDTDICVSVDLQKIIMLPRINTFKSVLFTPRLIAYHESFVRVGKKEKNLYPYAVIWHEAISGRSKEDIISTYYAFICFHRDAKKITIWSDNCSAQNKNWTLFSFLIYIVNSDEVAVEEIIVKYFEAGHTFISADTFHHCVEKSLKSQNKTYDFSDFQEAVRKATSTQVDVKEMDHLDFFQWKDYSSIYKLKNKKFNSERPYISDIVTIRAVRGLKTLAYRTSYDGNEVEMNFLNRAGINEMNKPQSLTRPVGIPEDRKKSIINKLGRLMPKNRLPFWENLPICSE